MTGDKQTPDTSLVSLTHVFAQGDGREVGNKRSKRQPSIFDIEIPPCPNPKRVREAIPGTGELLEIPFVVVTNKGEVVAGCGRNVCLECCSILNARKISAAIHLAQPDLHFSVTCLKADPRKNSELMGHLMGEVRLRHLHGMRYCWAAEIDPSETVIHTHGYIHGVGTDLLVIQEAFDRAARRRGLGRVHVGPVPRDADVRYFGYPFKCLADPAGAEEFLDLNGPPTRRTLIHNGNWFWRDGPHGKQNLSRTLDRWTPNRGGPRWHS